MATLGLGAILFLAGLSFYPPLGDPTFSVLVKSKTGGSHSRELGRRKRKRKEMMPGVQRCIHKKVLVLLFFCGHRVLKAQLYVGELMQWKGPEIPVFLFCADDLPSQRGEIFDGKKRDATSVPAALPRAHAGRSQCRGLGP